MRKLSLLLGCIMFVATTFCQSNVPTGVSLPSVSVQPISSPLSVHSSVSPSYNRTFIPTIPITDTSLINMNADPAHVSINTSYMDDMGRVLQNVTRQASTSKKDLVAINLYDGLGRNSLNMLPYVATTGNYSDGLIKQAAIGADSAFYKAVFPEEQVFFGRTHFDASPINSVKKVMAPGNSWNGSGIGKSIAYRTNNTADSVRMWMIGIVSENDIPVTNAMYLPGTLNVVEVTAEDGKKTITYSDELGRKILSKSQLAVSPATGHSGWLCSYMVYDEMNKLRFFISPKATEALCNTLGWNLAGNPALVSGLCYRYFYDSYGRLSTKGLPDKGKIYLIYDLKGRIVLAQDSILRAISQWQFTKYDNQNRAVKAGLITLSGLSRANVETAAGISDNYPVLTGTYSILSEVYYDDYSWVSSSGSGLSGSLVTTDINANNFITETGTAPDYAASISASNRIRGTVTGSKTLILGSSVSLYNINFYDDKGRVIQTSSTNITGGKEVATIQYAFNSSVLRSLLSHEKAGPNNQTHKLLSVFVYDHLGRVTSIKKQINGQSLTTISAYTYNELGQVNTKTLGSNLEVQNFSYNIRGWLRGINKDFAAGNSGGQWFGEELYYDHGFNQNQLTGLIAGQRWKSKGDGKFRAYGYAYDAAGRLTKADFTQNETSVNGNWNTSKGVDFSVSNLRYDANGNMQSMTQKGLKINASDIIDSLTYGYNGLGNQLSYVTDAKNDAASRLGDFKEVANNATADYGYDGNGNITSDNNKNITSITYNFMNLPQTITVAGKGSIEYTYDGKGTRLKKKTTEGGKVTTTTYIAGFIYKNDTLQLAGHEEGRLRPSALSGNQSVFAYDYFVKDHLGNTRMVLTAEEKTDFYIPASMESAPATVAAEDLLYANLNTTRLAKPTGYPTDTYTSPNDYVSRVKAAAGSQTIGPSRTFKVMSGDRFHIRVSSWYKTGGTQPDPSINPFSYLVNALSGGVSGVSGSGGHAVTQTVLQNNNILGPAAQGFLNAQAPNTVGSKPKAFLNWILFDEQFNYVATGSNSEQVGANEEFKVHVKTDMPVTANGYLYVYVSNATPNIDVYFDNLQVTLVKGPLLQENHYYPHGLAMAGISSSAVTATASNVFKANGSSMLGQEEWADGSGLELYETPNRSYDAQIGRFGQTDPIMEHAANVSSYAFVLNNPVSQVDPSGLQEIYDQWWNRFSGAGNNNPFGHLYQRKKDMDGGGRSSFDWSKHSKDFVAARPTSQSGRGAYFNDLWSKWTKEGLGDEGTYWFSKGGQYNADPYYTLVFGTIKNGQWNTKLLQTGIPSASGSNAFEATASKQIDTYSVGTGFQVSTGIGLGKHGTQLTVGAFGSGMVRQLFFTVTTPDPYREDFSFDYSASAQFMVGYAQAGNFDLSGAGRNYGYGFDPISVSYSTDRDVNSQYGILAIGPSVGVKYSGAAGKSQTYTVPYVQWGLFGGMMWK